MANPARAIMGLSMAIFMGTIAMLRLLFRTVRNPRGLTYVKDRPEPPKCLTDGWNHGFLQLSDVKLHYVYDGDASNPLMLFVHGFPEFWYTWRHQMQEFKKDYRVVAIDNRGYGDSDKPTDLAAYKIDKLGGDVKEVVKKLGYSSCVLVAHDWGGAIAWYTSLKYPDMVDKLIICNCPHPMAMRENLATNWKQMLRSWYMTFFQLPSLPEFYLRSFDLELFDEFFCNPRMGGCKNPNAFSEQDLEAFKYTFSKPGAFTPPVNYYRAIFRFGRAGSGGGSMMTIPPVLIIWGTGDIALGTELASMSADNCNAATVKYVDGASHWVQNDEPKVVNQYMRQFLKGDSKL